MGNRSSCGLFGVDRKSDDNHWISALTEEEN
jgi:hypothetical protein